MSVLMLRKSRPYGGEDDGVILPHRPNKTALEMTDTRAGGRHAANGRHT